MNHAVGIQYPVNLMLKWDYLALLSYGETKEKEFFFGFAFVLSWLILVVICLFLCLYVDAMVVRRWSKVRLRMV